jgi:hypothetical protein
MRQRIVAVRAKAAEVRQRIGVDWSERSTKVGAAQLASASGVLYLVVDAGIKRLPEGWVFTAFIFGALGVLALFGAKNLLVKDKPVATEQESVEPDEDDYIYIEPKKREPLDAVVRRNQR